VTDEGHMDHALRLGARGLGRTWPNPAVGCVIVADGRVVGRGWTAPGGRPHAEPQALAQAGAAARGATVYVTLEPCAHHGRTPPCTDALIAAGPARVVTALTDPDPRVSGRGHALLRAAGIAVTTGVQEAAARSVNAGFLKRVTRGLPFVTLKMAASLDGRSAMPSGESRWITGPEARRVVHAMRMTHDAVLVGAGTARADDPDLGVRDMGAPHQPLRMVLDPRLSHRPDSRLGRAAGGGAVWMLHTDAAPAAARDAWAATGARLIEVPADGTAVDLRGAMQALAREGITRVLCEGGAVLAAGLLRAALVDEIALFQGGVLIGAEGHGVLGPLGLPLLSDAARPNLVSVDRIGADTLSRWTLAP
jgi:diaminohydroxyphosphoribosylaminopyrimidine deaminase / 5-amino-6-(5-phosphoribosylamino)uracil reductase